MPSGWSYFWIMVMEAVPTVKVNVFPLLRVIYSCVTSSLRVNSFRVNAKRHAAPVSAPLHTVPARVPFPLVRADRADANMRAHIPLLLRFPGARASVRGKAFLSLSQRESIMIYNICYK